MEAVAAYAAVVLALGDGIADGDIRIGLVESRVEAGELRQFRCQLSEGADESEAVRIMQRSERDAGLDLGDHIRRQAARRDQSRAAMDDAVRCAVEFAPA